MHTIHPRIRLTLLAGLAAAFAACGESTGVGSPNRVDVLFQVSGTGGAASGGGPAPSSGSPLAITGTNGTLVIDEIRVVVAEIELEKIHDSCNDDDHVSVRDDDCEEFDAGPRFIDLPLDGSAVEVGTDLVPPGTYDELEFEIEDLDDDEDNAAEAALIAAVRAEVLAEFPDWPRDASALVVGSFTPHSGSPVGFRVYLDAEIEVELELNPDLVIDGESASRDLTVDVEPVIWFSRPDGSVVDLSQYDFDDTGGLLELEVEFEDGFTEIEVEN
jgi:hypothetical protein